MSSATAWKRFQDPATARAATPFDHPALPLLGLDADGTLRHVSPAARALLGYGSDEAVPSYFFTHVHPRHLHQVMHDLAHMAAHRQARAAWLLRLRTGRGRWRWYQATVRNRLAHDADRCIVVALKPAGR
jgi:PAS domain S-box-containing protein